MPGDESFRRFLDAGFVLALASAALVGAAGLRLGAGQLLVLATAGAGVAAALLLARHLARQGQTGTALWSMALACDGAALVMLVVRPQLAPAMAFVPVMVLAFAFAVRGRAVPVMAVVGSWALTLGILVVGLMLPARPDAAVPPWFDAVFLVLGVSGAAGIATMTLWRTDRDLRDALGQAHASREDLQKANDRLRSYDAMKTQLMNNIAHELNTPLTPIVTLLHRLRRQSEAAAEHDRAMLDSLNIMDRNVARLRAITEDALQVTRMEAGRLDLRREPLDLGDVVAEAARSFQAPAEQRGLQLAVQVEEGLRMMGDARRLGQVLDNLLTNAIKFSRGPGEVRIEACADGAGMAVVRVTDQGPGLTPAQAGRLFAPFSRVHDMERDATSGVGLGLYIARGIMEAHGGRIWCESPGPGLGATFLLALPLERPMPAASPQAPGLGTAAA